MSNKTMTGNAPFYLYYDNVNCSHTKNKMADWAEVKEVIFSVLKSITLFLKNEHLSSPVAYDNRRLNATLHGSSVYMNFYR